jgi:TolB-like protein/DNA-binding winged helix-turn-helix (wHTH) protein/Tfp pilus assembly protein PilF
MAQAAQYRRVFRFGIFEVDLRSGELHRKGVKIKLQEQPFQVLSALLERPGELVTREEIRENLWPDGTFVDFDHSLNTAIMRLREALNDSADNPRFVETLGRRGYRFIAPVQSLGDDSSGREPTGVIPVPQIGSSKLEPLHWKLAAGILGVVIGMALAIFVAWRAGRRDHPTTTIRSIAVLPLENLSGDATQDYFADGMTDELITDLGQLGELRVISRTSIMQYKGVHKPLPQIARELGVDAVVEGTVLRSGDRVRITAKLVQAPLDKHLWAQTYEGDLRDVLGLQNEVAGAVAEQIRIKLTPQQRAVLQGARIVNPQAHEAYLRGHSFAQQGSVDGYERSILYFNQAIAMEPDHALAYIGLADSYIMLGHLAKLAPQQAFPAAERAAMKALQLDGSSAEAHQALANVKFLYDWDFPDADQEFRRALVLNPNSVSARAFYSDYLMAMGRFDESIVERKRNRQIDPLALRPLWALAGGYYFAHRYDEAVAQARKVIEMDPNHWSGHLCLGLSLEQQHRFPQAMAELRKAMEVSNDRLWVGFLAHDMALSGDKAGAHKILAELQQLSNRTYVSPWLSAMVYPDLGDREQAFVWLEKCYRGREHDLVFSKVWPMFDVLRSDPRYQDLMRRVGLPQ